MILSRSGGDGSGLIVRRIDNRFVNRLIRRMRTSRDSQWIEKNGAVAIAVEAYPGKDSFQGLLDRGGKEITAFFEIGKGIDDQRAIAVAHPEHHSGKGARQARDRPRGQAQPTVHGSPQGRGCG